MDLRKFAYTEFATSQLRYWELLDFDLKQVNLVVGKNSAGKSRTLNVIDSLSKVLANPSGLSFDNGHYKAEFVSSTGSYYFLELEIEGGHILKEILQVNHETLLERNEANEGRIFNAEVKKYLGFQLPHLQLAVARRDKIQYPYLEELFEWASKVRHFHFNTPLGKQAFAFIENSASNIRPINIKEVDRVVETFHFSNMRYDFLYRKKVIDDFNRIGYCISDIKIDNLVSLSFDKALQNPPKGILVKEEDRFGYTDQNEMSMGMFRALSVIINFNAYELADIPGCILIDDIGEGLDFEKSTNLINLLIEKTKGSKVQLIMSSNDKFVMNNTDLEYWQIIKREGSKVKLFNKENSKKQFEDFAFTGLNNFDFFRSDFYEKGFSIE